MAKGMRQGTSCSPPCLRKKVVDGGLSAAGVWTALGTAGEVGEDAAPRVEVVQCYGIAARTLPDMEVVDAMAILRTEQDVTKGIALCTASGDHGLLGTRAP